MTTLSLALNEDERMLRDTAARFFADTMPTTHLRAMRAAGTPHDAARWREMAGLGFAGLGFAEARGGSGLGMRALAVVMEEAGRTLALTPLPSTAGCVARALEGGDFAAKEEWAARFASGEAVGALALEEGARHAPSQIATQARQEGGVWILDGDKSFVPHAVGADCLLVVARVAGAADAQDGLGLFLTEASGVVRQPLTLMDGSDAARIPLRGVRAVAALAPGTAWSLLDAALDAGRVAQAAEAIGSAQEIFDRTMDYLKTRRQFDAPIGSFQALQHRAADLFCELELARSAVRAAAAAQSAAGEAAADNSAALASLAKATASDVFRRAAAEGIQMHGGIGMTDEHDAGLFYKRARVSEEIWGSARWHRSRYATLTDIPVDA